jgi:Cell division septal protein
MQPLSAPAAPRRDPAPSRTAYRLQRLWLTPVFRSLVRTGVPAFALCFGLGIYLTDDATQEAIHLGIAEVRREIAERPEFTVKLMAIDGASAPLAEDIREILPLDFPASSFDLDLEHMRSEIAGLDAVDTVEVRLRPGGILQVDVTERMPVAVWRSRHGLELIDLGGRRVGPLAARPDRPDLPLLAGAGADEAVEEALQLIRAAAPVLPRFRGLVRVGERRWDVVLDRDQRILLPEAGRA